MPLQSTLTASGYIVDLLPSGSEIWTVGTICEGVVAGAVRSMVMADSGSDTVDHAQILWIANCTLAGNPDLPDNALAASRFAAYLTDAEVIKSGCDGASSSEALFPRYPALWMLHFGLVGASTAAAGNTFTTSQFAVMTFNPDENVIAAEIRLTTPRLGTTGKRYRDVFVTPYSVS